MAAADVEKVLGSFDTSTAKGTRDHLMILLMARLGLRISEVASLHVGDIDWDAGRLFVTGKGSVRASLPLPQEVGDALLRHLAYVRPSNARAHLFVRFVTPRRPLRQQTVGTVFRVAARAVGISGRFCGAHRLRHSLATNLLREGASLEQIGALLRHKSTATTEIYAKVDFATLRRIAQPWPLARGERLPC
jgi:site-specific recombinase XerD